jgi:hypothetical protein
MWQGIAQFCGDFHVLTNETAPGVGLGVQIIDAIQAWSKV